MPGENIQDWSTTATLNSNSDSSINWAEGQPRASVNNSARSMMAAHAKQRNLLNGSIVAGGVVNALTFFSGLAYTATPTGLVVRLKIGPALTNTGAATLNMDNIGAVAILGNSGVALTGGELLADSYQDFVWNGTNWILLATLTAPTATPGDADSSIANTAFVSAAITAAITTATTGVTDGSEAAAGKIGEFKTASSGAWNVAIGAVGTLCSLALDAGDWQVWGVVGVGPGASAAGGFATLLIGSTLNAASPALSYHGAYTSPSGEYYNGTVPMRVFNAAGAYHLNMLNSGSSPAAISGVAASARIFARRVR
jgi:hypothetical protein